MSYNMSYDKVYNSSIPSKEFIIEHIDQMLINRYNEDTFVTNDEHTKNFIVGLVIRNTIEQLMTWFTKNPGDVNITVDSKLLEDHAAVNNCSHIIPLIVTTKEIVSRTIDELRSKNNNMSCKNNNKNTKPILTVVQLHDISYIEELEKLEELEEKRIEELYTLNFDDLNTMLEAIPISEDVKLKLIKDAKSLEKEAFETYLR